MPLYFDRQIRMGQQELSKLSQNCSSICILQIVFIFAEENRSVIVLPHAPTNRANEDTIEITHIDRNVLNSTGYRIVSDAGCLTVRERSRPCRLPLRNHRAICTNRSHILNDSDFTGGIGGNIASTCRDRACRL